MMAEPIGRPDASVATLLTVGHGTLAASEFAALVRGAGIEEVVDVRTAPGSRRHPHFSRDAMAQWLPEAGLHYRWEKDLGGFRRPRPDSPNLALRNDGFRGYADYMATPTFRDALARLLDVADGTRVAVMCAEALWWRCHRRLIADAVVLGHGRPVCHLLHDGRFGEHRLTDGVRPADDGQLVYDVGVDRPLL